jgi:hypothetical protein
MWDPRRLTNLWTSTACYRDSFTFSVMYFWFLTRRDLILSLMYPNITSITKNIELHSSLCIQVLWMLLSYLLRSRDSGVGIATDYGLDDGAGVRVPVKSNFSLLEVVQTDCKPHPAFYPKGSGGSFSGVKRPGREADHSTVTSAEVKRAWLYTSTPPYVFMVWCLIS